MYSLNYAFTSAPGLGNSTNTESDSGKKKQIIAVECTNVLLPFRISNSNAEIIVQCILIKKVLRIT